MENDDLAPVPANNVGAYSERERKASGEPTLEIKNYDQRHVKKSADAGTKAR